MSNLSPNQAYNKCIEILRKYESGSQLYPSDCRFVSWFAQRHPDKEMLFDNWSGDILVKDHPLYPNKCFWIIKKDGQLQHFGLKNCKTGMYPTKIENFRRACGTAIRDYLRDIRIEYVRENKLYGMFNVHHAEIKFNDLVDMFIRDYGINVKKVKFDCDPIRFIDKELEQDWFEYHNRKAILKVVTIEQHKEIHRIEDLYFGGLNQC